MFVDEATRAAVEWKERTGLLTEDARRPGHYQGKGKALDFCLPVEFADLNLVPEARDWAIAYFRRAGIPWHHGLGSNPGNHLLSSQVQCVNALAPLTGDPDALRTVFGSVLDIAEVLPFGDPADDQSHVAFEWVGLDDHLNEHPGRLGSRGANNTSADAAIRYRAPSGKVEVVLIEWKFTERYTGQPLSGGARSKAVRVGRYAPLFVDPDGPIRVDLLPLDAFLVEPIYQLLRLQLLAWRMEATRELDVDRVRVVYAAPSRNTALWRLPTDELQTVAGHLYDLWPTLLRVPDRFVLYDTAALVEPGSPTTAEFKDRYRPLGPAAPWPAEERVGLEEAATTALAWAQAVFLRLGTEGGVIDQALEPGALEAVGDGELREITARANEAAELARRLRAEELFNLLQHDLT